MTNSDLFIKVYAANVKWKLYMEAEGRGEPEKVTDALYLDYHNTVGELALDLEKVTGGEIDHKTAVNMAHWKREEIAAILNKAQ